MARELEAVGALGGFGGALIAGAVSDALHTQAERGGHTAQPFCPRCARPTGIHVTQMNASQRARLDPTAEWACFTCGQKIA
jgi:hypothetical protein